MFYEISVFILPRREYQNTNEDDDLLLEIKTSYRNPLQKSSGTLILLFYFVADIYPQLVSDLLNHTS